MLNTEQCLIEEAHEPHTYPRTVPSQGYGTHKEDAPCDGTPLYIHPHKDGGGFSLTLFCGNYMKHRNHRWVFPATLRGDKKLRITQEFMCSGTELDL